MSLIILAGILNGTATIFLKLSNKTPFLIWISIFLFGLNFLFFRSGLQSIKAASGYSVLISISLLTVLFYDVFTKAINITTPLFFSVALYLSALFLFLKYSN